MDYISNILECSTAHIKEETKKQFDEEQYFGLIVYEKKIDNESYGWFIPLTDNWREKSLPDEVTALFDYAEKHGCQWVMLDRDADIIFDLPFYYW